MHNAPLNHAAHLYPTADGKAVLKLSLRQTRVRFESGRKFCDDRGQILTIADIPENSNVVLHTASRQKLHLRVIPVK
jgi:hypothetical protein